MRELTKAGAKTLDNPREKGDTNMTESISDNRDCFASLAMTTINGIVTRYYF
ncbi:MAG: hypothetical protein ABII09_10520 [Planctomycetota bacterium]